jgi:hypothetical protein
LILAGRQSQFFTDTARHLKDARFLTISPEGSPLPFESIIHDGIPPVKQTLLCNAAHRWRVAASRRKRVAWIAQW